MGCRMAKLLVASLCAVVVFTAGAHSAAAQGPGASWGWPGRQPAGAALGDPKLGGPTAESKCAACHGANGNNADSRYPKLAGQSASYLYSQLWAFRTGDRKSDIMAGIASALSDVEMADVASFYSRHSIRADAINDAGLAALGQRIFVGGASRGGTPPCAMCHARATQRGRPMMMGMMSMMASVPSLNGQHATYIMDQLDRFASGRRQNIMMARIAASLSEMEKTAVAEYVAGLP
jgi:cytochrome c553